MQRRRIHQIDDESWIGLDWKRPVNMNGHRNTDSSVRVAPRHGAATGLVGDRVNGIRPAAFVMVDNQHGSNGCAGHVDNPQRSAAVDRDACHCDEAGSNGDGTEAARSHPLQIVADTKGRELDSRYDGRAERVRTAVAEYLVSADVIAAGLGAVRGTRRFDAARFPDPAASSCC
jgi:hypothetical protein